MGYNERNPSFTFRFGEYRHGKLNKLAKAAKMSTVDYVRSAILDPFLNGDLIPKAKDDLALEMQKLKIEKTKAEIEYLKLKNKYLETFGAPMSNSATRILKPQITTITHQASETKSPYDESNKRFRCVDCNALFPYGSMDGFLTQMLEYKNHIVANHNRELNAIEKDVFNKITFLGASK